MNIIAHRGYWKVSSEMNTRVAFERALINGFGIETDICLLYTSDAADE